MRRPPWLGVLLLMTLGACGGGAPKAIPEPVTGAQPASDAARPPPRKKAAPPATRSRIEADTLARFEARLKQHGDLTYVDFARTLSLSTAPDPPLPFDPTGVLYFDKIARELSLTPEETALFKKTGVVAVDHARPYSIGSLYHAIYARELPVLVTTNSVLHALHRSYDNVLKQLESTVMTQALNEALRGAHDALAKDQAAFTSPALAASAADVDLYLTVARSLLEGSTLPSKLGNDADVGRVLANVAALAPPVETPIYGGARAIDFSQFAPRGHYTETEALQRYFRAMMWIGRADTGFILAPPDPQSRLDVQAEREVRSAALLTWALKSSGKIDRIRRASAIVDFLVGASDNVTVDEVATALDRAGANEPAALVDSAKIAAISNELAQAATQNVRSQFLVSEIDRAEKVESPKLFQLFGQRFTIDGFVLSQVVFDGIVFKGKKQLRMMPSELDVMAALGSNEAATLLRPELEKFNYSANLLAARETVAARSDHAWQADVYDMWIDVLRSLDAPPSGKYAPTVMKREPWRRKTLETQLASWAELRHDTILYAKQSYTAYPMCGYPAGFVEPYPEVYAKLEKLARQTARGLGTIGGLSPQVAFFQRFADVMALLERLSKKELAAQPFTKEEETFLKTTIDATGGGSGPPRYDGWYPTIIYGEVPDKWHPTVADVHTDPASNLALEVGVGSATFLVVAIDNGNDRAAYVGPMSSFYSFNESVRSRLTDEEWQKRISSGSPPARPAFTSVYRAPAKGRDLGPLTPKQLDPQDPRVVRIQKLFQQSQTAKPEDRQRLHEEMQKLQVEIKNPPLPR